jgi:hypothetical protein
LKLLDRLDRHRAKVVAYMDREKLL